MSGISRIKDVARRMGFVRAAPGQVPVMAIPSATGNKYFAGGAEVALGATATSAPPDVFATAEVADPLTGTPQSVTPPPGTTYCRVSYLRTGGTVVGKVAHIAFNAVSSFDASALLSDGNVREVIALGETREFYFETAPTRIDVKSDAATEAAGSTVVLLEFGTDTDASRTGYQISNDAIADKLSTSISTIKIFEPADFVDLSYLKIGASANGFRMFAVFNAAGDADAAVKLASGADRVTIPLDTSERFLFPQYGCTRIDLKTDALSETAGSTLVLIERGAA